MGAFQVIPDVNHPRASAATRRDPLAPYLTAAMTRVFLVRGLDQISLGMPAAALAKALASSGIPRTGDLAPGPAALYGAIALDYDSEPIPQSDTDCYVIVGYRSPIPRSIDGGDPLFVTEDDSVSTQESTQLHPKSKQPIYINYTDPKDKNNVFPPILATFRYTRSLRKLIISGYVGNNFLGQVKAAQNSVNDAAWFGYDIGFWRFDEFREEGTLLGNMSKVTAGFVSRKDENWMQWEVLRSEMFGERITVDQSEIDKIKAQGYVYDVIAGNGVTATGLHPMASFTQLFGIDDYPQNT